MTNLIMATCMAPVSDDFFAALAHYLAHSLGVTSDLLDEPDWRERERSFARGDVDLIWICGLPYVRMIDQAEPPARLVAAPVMAGERYEDRPVYFSDILVRASEKAGRLEELRGLRWAYNETGSHSGYRVFLAELARRGMALDAFGAVIEAGSHQRAIAMILTGEADFAAIDSTVLELVLERRPELAGQLRVVETLGPSPIPPLLSGARVPPALHDQLRGALVEMHNREAGRAALALGRVRRFARVEDEDYEPIRLADRLAASLDG